MQPVRGRLGKTTRNRALVDECVSRELLEYFSDDVLAAERIAARGHSAAPTAR